jgi:hypothetical protein
MMQKQVDYETYTQEDLKLPETKEKAKKLIGLINQLEFTKKRVKLARFPRPATGSVYVCNDMRIIKVGDNNGFTGSRSSEYLIFPRSFLDNTKFFLATNIPSKSVKYLNMPFPLFHSEKWSPVEGCYFTDVYIFKQQDRLFKILRKELEKQTN